MLSWQKDIITNNLSHLQSFTRISCEFLAIFVSKGVLGRHEETELTNSKNADAVAQLYRILETRNNGFHVLLSALEETNQSGALSILQTAEKNYLANFQNKGYVCHPDENNEEEPLQHQKAENEVQNLQHAENYSQKNAVRDKSNGQGVKCNGTVKYYNWGMARSIEAVRPMGNFPCQTNLSIMFRHEGYCCWDITVGAMLTLVIILASVFALTIYWKGNPISNLFSESLPVSGLPTVFHSTTDQFQNTAVPSLDIIYRFQNSTEPNHETKTTIQNKAEHFQHTTQSAYNVITPMVSLNQTVGYASGIHLHIVSFEDYTKQVRNIEPNWPLDVTINLTSPYNWPNHIGRLKYSYNVVNLTLSGPFTVTQITDILSKMHNLKRLRLMETGNKLNLCSRNKGQLHMVHSIKLNVSLPLLETLIIEDFSSCVEVYETLAATLKSLNSLQEIRLSYCFVDNSNIFAIMKLLMLTAKSLKSLLLPNTYIKSTAINFEEDVEGIVMPQVRVVRLDSNDNKLVFGSRFSDVFPNLQSFTSEEGFISWHSTKNLLNCKNLTSLSVMMHISDVNFNVSLLQTFSPGLQNANITLKFSSCDHDSTPNIIGFEKLGDLCITLWSNCKILVNLSKVPYQKLATREWKFDKENTWSKFTYIERSTLEKNSGYYCADYYN